MTRGIDCATPVTAQAAEILAAEGFRFVCRYLVPPESYSKALTRPEATRISDTGLDILCVWETSSRRMLDGAAAGREDGERAFRCARNLGMPLNAIIYFAADFDAIEADMPAIREYIISASIEIQPYRVGIYGGYRTIEAVKDMPIQGFWQCVAWSGGKVSDVMTVYQAQWSGTAECKALAARLGFAVDINECPDLTRAGMWSYRQPEPAKPVEPEADDVTGHWSEDAIRWCMAHELMTGYPDGSFRPDKPVTRAELSTVLRRLVLVEEKEDDLK